MPSPDTFEQQLLAHNVKPTAVRLLVWREVSAWHNAFSLVDVENAMPRMDRSSIFRALRLFVEHDLLHAVDDGTGLQKYCVCHCHSSAHLNHIHFNCHKCGRTFCLENYTIPVVSLPTGFQMHEAEYIVKGICPQCATEE